MTVISDLRAARALIEDRANWAQGDNTGDPGYLITRAVAPWCAGTALHGVGADHSAYQALREAIGNNSIADWNDSHTHAEVLAGFDRAIAAAKS